MERLLVAAVLVSLVGAVIVHNDDDHHKHIDYYAHPKYKFEYSVYDPHNHDFKKQEETREGDAVKGYYLLKESDGTVREVHYTADKKNGFNAVVQRAGHAVHPVVEGSKETFFEHSSGVSLASSEGSSEASSESLTHGGGTVSSSSSSNRHY